MRLLVLVIVLSGLAGCATIPDSIGNAPVESPSPAAVVQDAQRWQGQRVRWGGRIVDVQNVADGTWVAVLSEPLDATARPVDGEGGHRFLAWFKGFQDPEVYKSGRDLTVVGRLDGVRQRKVGAYDYSYPVVRVDGSQLWQPRTRRYPDDLPPWYHDPWYYDPFYHPWYGPWYYPYGRYW